ncbi:long-chain fatty acid--CoA ligase [Mumia sp. zg.B53]|uniref:AMP-dependent synthetase/ligase n=1 Tax=unclassified Mumia TaxID=2621872 RepID=UPI001C6E542B|nr:MULTISPECIES: long-chain fatty acid--CoA ligase [unclassified Mumia]MBW9206281.1 long-chain fatty acid--CoA ligase [Mumia sp. zg.B17]MBW9216598.1 long-chain fatty acid--CoA ligase [Mumia sp. zg.B53]MDD9347892.1 long-chain fatty acid--CoA ligase [Mumia sp.]
MRTYATPATYQVPETGSITNDILVRVDEDPDRVAFQRRVSGAWTDVTIAQFRDEVVSLAKGFVAAGVAPGDRVGLLSRTRYEWTQVDYALWWIGAVSVPIYESSSVEQISWILSDSAAVGCVVENEEHAERVAASGTDLTDLKNVWVIDSGLDTLAASGAVISDADLAARRDAVAPSDLATIIYTSGTTGRPKGAEITHANFMFELGDVIDVLPELFHDNSVTLLFLPLAHVFARIVEVGSIRAGAKLSHSPDVKNLLPELAEIKPTFLLAVPRVFEKIYNGASQNAHASGKGKIFDVATSTAIAYSRARESGKRIGPVLKAKHTLFDRLVYAKLRDAMGGHVEHAISGGAPLGERLAHFFSGIGIPVIEGYGLTETTAALAANLAGDSKIGTVGRPLPGTEVRVADDGELLFRGGQVFRGYWNAPEATAAAFDEDGWFHTGDIGEIDSDGFISITGRKKEIIVTAGGKNVVPAVLEDRIRAHVLVSQAVVVGEGKPFVGALITLDQESIGSWLENHGKPADTPIEQLADDPDVLAAVQTAVDEANSHVSRAEAIRKFRVLAKDWTEEGGQITPTLKLKRNVVMREHRDDVEALYG